MVETLISLGELPKYVEAARPRFRVVSLDVFDTLLRRSLPHPEVVRRAARTLRDLGARRGVPPAGAIETHRAAYAARVYDVPADQEKEWMVDEWLTDLASAFALDRAEVRRLGIRAELACEKRYTRPAPGARRALGELAAAGFAVIAVSDTNHSRASLEHLLGHFDLLPQAVYSSASLGRSKRLGTLFRHVAAEMGVPPQGFLHVGDDPKRDVVRAREAGWRALWLAEPRGGATRS